MFFLSTSQECCWIRHDKDLNDDGEYKKPHYHFVLKLKNACTISALSKNSFIPENLIEPIKKSLNGALKYLIHFQLDDKYQYSAEEVQSNSIKLKEKFMKLVTEQISEVQKVITIQDYIEKKTSYVSWSELGKFAQENDFWDAFRRNLTYFDKLLNSHNGRVNAIRYHHGGNYLDD